MLSAIAILSVLEVVIGWFMKGRGLWSFYKDLKKWIKEKKEQKEVKEVKKVENGYKQEIRTVYRSTKRKSNRRIIRSRKVA